MNCKPQNFLSQGKEHYIYSVYTLYSQASFKILIADSLISSSSSLTMMAVFKSGPSTPSNPPSTPIPGFQIPSSQPPPLLLTNGESHVDPEPITEPNPNPNQESWVIYTQQMLQEAKDEKTKNPWENLSIYRVPNSLREGDIKAYIPQKVSIGPFHHGKEELRKMEPHKWRAVNQVLQRTGHDIDRYINAIRPLEERIRSCYEGHILMGSDEFLLSLVVDGIFVLELFVGATSQNGFGAQGLGYSDHDPVFAMRCVLQTIQREMIMLENQIPLFVLARIRATQTTLPDQPEKPDQPKEVARLAVHFFDPLMPSDEPLHQRDRALMATTRDVPLDVGLHCLDAYRLSLLRAHLRNKPQPQSSATRRVADRGRQQFIHCVSELREAGIRCRKSSATILGAERAVPHFMDISFDKGGTLQIPKIVIDDETKSLFLNLIAFEQCHLDASSSAITSYVIFMCNLINTEDDVRYLHDRGIIEHWLGNDKEVADMFSRLCKEVVFDNNNSYLSDLSNRINKYYDNRWNKWMATLKHSHLRNPWAIISLLAAVLLLALTFTQTFYSAYAYYRPLTSSPPSSPSK